MIHPFKPKPWQIAPWRDTSPVLLLTGSAGGGKSRLAAEKIHAYLKRYPNASGLMVRKTRDSMINSTILLMTATVIGDDPTCKHRPSKHRFEYANGSILAYGGMADQQQREQIRSIGRAGALDIAWMEEGNGFVESDYNEILARMRGTAAPWRQIIISTNPDAPSHWIYQRLILGREATTYYSTAADNDANPADYQANLDKLTGLQRARLRDGQWIAATGAVYDEFDHRLHVRERSGPWIKATAGVDDGYTNPACILVILTDSQGRRHIAEEFYQSRVIQADLVRAAQALAVKWNIETFRVDPAAASLIAAMRAAGLNAVPAVNDLRPGIQTIKAALRPDPTGEPMITISPLCTNTIYEFQSYVWKPATPTTPETPLDENNHAMAALRYHEHTNTQPTQPSFIIQPPETPTLAERSLNLHEHTI